LTYLKACHVAGNAELGRQTVFRLVSAVSDRFATFPSLAEELHQMRRRLEKEVVVPPTNNKTAPGGYYDIDFAVSFLRLRGNITTPAGANMAEQIATLRSAGLMNNEDAKDLSDGVNFLRAADHAIRLVTGKAANGLPERAGHAESVENLARRWGLVAGQETLAQSLERTHRRVRDIYRRLVDAV
jgi:glutamine synthetase adenylyltransferase